MDRSKRTFRKIVVLLLGLPIIAIGFILLPLPGPGWPFLLLGFFILAQEFSWAEKRLEALKKEVKKVGDEWKKRVREIKQKE